MMIKMKKDSIVGVLFDLKQLSDNERINYDVTGLVVTFHAKKVGPSLTITGPNPTKTITIICNNVNPLDGLVRADFTAADTDTTGEYECYIEVTGGGETVFNKYPFKMEIWDV